MPGIFHMKKILFFSGLFALSLASCGPAGWNVQNPADLERPDEIVIFTRALIAEKAEIPDSQWPLFLSDGKPLPCQADDLDGDGAWDEAAVLVQLAPLETKKLQVSFVNPADYPSFEKRTNLRLGILQPDGSYQEVDRYLAPSCRDSFRIIAQAESVNWENDKFGFRNYFDCRNVKDLFGKLKPQLVIDNLQMPGTPSYHNLTDWGMDVLHCGSSLGSGGIALLKNDSLFRLGSTDVYEYVKITEGPVRSICELRYDGWDVDGEKLGAVERITVYPGKYWFQSDVTVKGLPDKAQVVTGIVTSRLKNVPFEIREGGFVCIGTHDIQSLNNDELGMAVILPEGETGKIGRTTDINFFNLGFQTVKEKSFSHIISETYYVSQRAADNQPVRHWFAAVWGLEKEQWKSEQGFRKYLSEEMKKLASPLIVQ